MAMRKVKDEELARVRREKFEKVKCDNCGRVFAVAASQADKIDCPKCVRSGVASIPSKPAEEVKGK